MGKDLEKLKSDLRAKQAGIEELKEQIEKEEALEARGERLLTIGKGMSSMVQRISNERLGEISKKVLMRDVFTTLRRHLHVEFTYNPDLAETPVAGLLCLFMEDSPLQENVSIEG